MSRPTNPPAFPITPEIWGQHPDFHGMTLRDWFAGQALTGYLAGVIIDPAGNNPALPEPEIVASIIGRIADAMLAERTNRREG